MSREIRLGGTTLKESGGNLSFGAAVLLESSVAASTYATQASVSNVDNTSDANKPVSTAQQSALDLKTNNADIVDNVTTNDGTKPLSAAQGVALKALVDALSSDLTPQGNWDATTAAPSSPAIGDFWIVSVDGTTDLGGITDWKVGDWAVYTAGGWAKADHTDKVFSVNGYSGTVTLVKGDIGLGNVDNTSDANKPVSTAQQTALDLKADVVDQVRVRTTGVDLKTIANTNLYTVPAGKTLVITDIDVILTDVGTTPTAPEIEFTTDAPATLMAAATLSENATNKVASYSLNGSDAIAAGDVVRIGVTTGGIATGNYTATTVMSGYLI